MLVPEMGDGLCKTPAPPVSATLGPGHEDFETASAFACPSTFAGPSTSDVAPPANQKEQSAAIHSEACELRSKVTVPVTSLEDCDPATGLPGPLTAELAMQQAIASHVHTYIVLFAVGLGSVTRRFGCEHGDAAFAAFAKQIASVLGSDDLLFRWKGPTLVALLERPDSNDAAPPEMSRLAAFQPEFTLKVGGRSTNIRPAMSSISFRIWKYDDLQAIRQALDEFQKTFAPEPVQEPATAKQGA